MKVRTRLARVEEASSRSANSSAGDRVRAPVSCIIDGILLTFRLLLTHCKVKPHCQQRLSKHDAVSMFSRKSSTPLYVHSPVRMSKVKSVLSVESSSCTWQSCRTYAELPHPLAVIHTPSCGDSACACKNNCFYLRILGRCLITREARDESRASRDAQ